jgi:uncharacterized protein YhaN
MRLEEIGEVSDLPEGFLDAWRGADQARQNARLALQRAEDAHRDREADLEQSPAPGRILDLRGEIEALSEEIGRYRNGMADEPKLARDIQKSDADIGEHLRGLGLADDPAAGRAALPPTPVVAGVRELLGRAGRVEAAAASASLALAKAREEHRETCEGHARHVEATDPESLNALLSQAAAMGDSGALLMKASSQAERAETGLAEALAQLPGWTASATALVATAFPVPDTVSRFEREIHARQQDLADARRDAAAARERLRDTDATLAGLRAAGPVPSPAAIDAARDHRDRGWRVVRATYIDQEVPTPEDVEAFGAGDDLGDRFERAVRQADALADQRGTEAERVAQFVTLTQDRHVFADRAETCMEADASAEVELRSTEQAWRDLWAGTGVAPDEPAAMRAWLARRDGVVRALQETRLAQDAVLEAKAQAQRAREILLAAAADLGLDAADEMALPALDRAVRKAVSDAVQAWQSRRMSADRVAEGARRVKEAEGSAAAADAALAGWRADWAGAMSKLSLAETTRPAEAEAAIDAWEAIRRILINRDQAARRLEGLRRDNERFRSNLSELVFSLGEEGSGLDAGGDPQGSLKLLRERLEAAKALSTRRSQALAARDSSAEVLVKARAKDRAAADACEALRVSHGIAEGADVPRMVEIAAERRRKSDEFANKRDEIVAACDGLSEVQVRAELAEVGPDEAKAELDASQSTMDGLVARSQEATQRETEARLALKALAERDGVNTAAQRARNAAQAAAEHLERWMRLTAAKSLLERALELYRSENEHPLVKRGGEFFCAMAGTGENPIVRLKVDHGDESTPQLVGVRRDGADCPVPGMSEGTRDQLYLALRFAAVEQYVLTHEPLPFIADDLFMTTDHVRVEAGVRALAEIGRSTQVILFTHHRHVLLAAMRLPLGTVKEHRLAPIPHGMEVMAASGKLEQRIR